MRSVFRRCSMLLATILVAMVPVQAGVAAPRATCVDGTLPSGARSRICIPASGWNGGLTVYAHGYTAPGEPLDFSGLTLADGTSLPDLVQARGFAFATTSYRQNGLAVLQGVDDMRELIAAVPAVAGRTPTTTYVLGVSEGGLVSTLLVERHPELVNGGIAACGPIGDFGQQLDHFSDTRVLFDYFFPGVLPGSATNIPAEVQANWSSVYQPKIQQALGDNADATAQLIAAARLPTGEPLGLTRLYSIISVLWYNVFATNDAVAKLGGNPYGNVGRVYSGSADDAALNAGVARFTADPAATQALAAYQTTGAHSRPLLLLHTTADPIVPFGQAQAYAAKERAAGGARFGLTPVDRFGHCTFQAADLTSAFDQLTQQRAYLPLTQR